MAAPALAGTLLAPLGADAVQEETVVYHENVKGFLATPDNASKSPALILMHDFGGLDEEMRRRARAFVRRWHLNTVLPLARLVEHELTEKLEAEVKLTFDTYALDMVSRSQVVAKLTAAGVALPVALAAVGLETEA